MESSTSSSQVSADVALGGSQVSMWATVLGKPEVNTDRGLPWVRIEVSYKWSPMGPSSLGLFECRNRLVKRCALLAPKDQIQVMGAEQMESQPKYPMWLIKDFRLIK